MVNHMSVPALRFPREKAYLQIDKPYYRPGDTLWFKAYVVDATSLGATPRSGLLYVEVADARGVVEKRIMVPLILGTGRGYLALDDEGFQAGAYTLSAYTNWMRNFGTRAAFRLPFSIRNYSSAGWLVRAGFGTVSGTRGRIEDTAHLYLTRLKGEAVSYRNLEVSLADSGKVYHRSDLRTDVGGAFALRFAVPGKADPGTLELRIRDQGPGERAPLLRVPIFTGSLEGGALQFMPEGGNLVIGLRCKVAFKALGPAGRGVPVSGTIRDDSGRVVTPFSATHLGMGFFFLTPEQGVAYHAVVPMGGDKSLSFPLPPALKTGAVLSVRNSFDEDSVEIRVFRGGGAGAGPTRYFLVGMSRGIGCFGALIQLDRHGVQTVRVSKDIFPTGIATVMLLTTDMRVLCRRLVYIDRHDMLHASFHVTQESGDSMRVAVTVTDSARRPVAGSFSVAVTDDSRLSIDGLSRPSVASSLLLSSDLKGWVEDPGYYFHKPVTQVIWQHLDNLLLTQGWAVYPPDTTREGKPRYPPETSFSVSGRVTNIVHKPVSGSRVLLLATRPPEVKADVTDSAGAFMFQDLYPIDTAAYMLQATNKRHKHFNVGIELNSYIPPSFPPLRVPRLPWYVDLDTLGVARVRRQVADQEQLNKLLGRDVLKEVVVVGQKVISGSKNLNGPGGSDLALSESDMKKAGKMTLRDVLARDVKAFRLGGKRLNVYVMGTSLVHLIIDGVNLDFFRPEGESPKQYYDQYLDYLTAEDIKGIEVMTSSRYTGAYFQKFIDPRSSPFDHVFIEITTYSGHGAFLKKTPGVFLYRPPLAFERPARFYRPARRADPRAEALARPQTVYWESDITTDADGKAVFSFRTNGPGRYSMILEGADMQGGILTTEKKLSDGK